MANNTNMEFKTIRIRYSQQLETIIDLDIPKDADPDEWLGDDRNLPQWEEYADRHLECVSTDWEVLAPDSRP